MLGQSLRTTTYLCGSQRCCTCGSVRGSRGIGEFLIHDNDTETLINCSDCWREKPKPHPKVDAHNQARGMRPFCAPIFPLQRIIKSTYRDVACRYLERHGGRTYREETAIDDYEVYLVNCHNVVVARISWRDRFPKPVDTSDFDDIPF